MAITATTLAAAVGISDAIIAVASASGISAPTTTTGAGFTYLFVDNELMFVQAVSGVNITVTRGAGGTGAVTHANATPVLIGGPSDFPNFTPAQGVEVAAAPQRFGSQGATITSAATIAPTDSVTLVSGTTQITSITLPPNFVSGRITLIFTGSGSGLTWTTGGTTGADIAVAGTATTAGSAVDFIYLPSTGHWYPSRLA